MKKRFALLLTFLAVLVIGMCSVAGAQEIGKWYYKRSTGFIFNKTHTNNETTPTHKTGATGNIFYVDGEDYCYIEYVCRNGCYGNVYLCVAAEKCDETGCDGYYTAHNGKLCNVCHDVKDGAPCQIKEVGYRLTSNGEHEVLSHCANPACYAEQKQMYEAGAMWVTRTEACTTAESWYTEIGGTNQVCDKCHSNTTGIHIPTYLDSGFRSYEGNGYCDVEWSCKGCGYIYERVVVESCSCGGQYTLHRGKVCNNCNYCKDPQCNIVAKGYQYIDGEGKHKQVYACTNTTSCHESNGNALAWWAFGGTEKCTYEKGLYKKLQNGVLDPVCDKCHNQSAAPGDHINSWVGIWNCTGIVDNMHLLFCSCNGCTNSPDYAEVQNVFVLLPHNFAEYVPDNNATCTEPGTKTATCTCPAEYNGLSINPSMWNKCNSAKDIKVDETKPALDHDPGPAATCTTPQVCLRDGCGVTLVPALQHIPSSPSSCTTDQYCTREGCGEVLAYATGHNYKGMTNLKYTNLGANHDVDGICPDCGEEIGYIEAHIYYTQVDGVKKCACGAIAPDYVAPIPDGLNPDDGWVYENGEKSDFTGLYPYNGGLFYILNGQWQRGANGLTLIIDEFWFLANGQVQEHHGFAEYDGEWFYLDGGKLDTTASSVYGYDGKTFLVAAGRLVSEYSGLAQIPSGEWYYVAEGRVLTEFSGKIEWNGATFQIVNGKLVA